MLINYDYKILQPDLNSDIGLKGRNQRKPLEALNQMVNWKRVDLLCHPVCTTYLEAKWWTYGLLFHVITLTLYVTFLTLLTFLILTGIDFDLRPNLRQLSIDRIKKYKPELLAGNATRVGPVDLSMPAGDVNMNVGDKTLLAFVISFAMLHLLKKVFQLRREGLSYFIRLITLFELTLYLSTMTFSIGFFDTANYYMTWQSQWLLGAVSILFAWVNMFFYLRRYGELGMHVMILLRTMKILTEAMVVLFVVVVAFSITFYAINPAKILPADPFFYTKSHDGDGMMDIYWTSYSSLQVAILRVSDQMIGDADVIVNFIDPILNGQMAFPVLTYIFAMISIVVITILLQSLVIGLTVGEIRDLRENVTLQRKIMQVDLHTEIEEKFTNVIMASWDIKPERRVYPNRMRSRFLKSILEYFAATEQKENDDTLVLRRSSSHPSISNEVMNDAKIVDELSAKVDQQHELLRTIIQSMKIQMEADILDDEDVEARRKKLSRFVDRSRPHSRFADSRSHGILDEE
ncbi:putative Transient receptor potential cation channel subfamily A member 1 [Hypsibius exemplaris]|uniref:Transient receptor potential cation channel subfamily A member 1 n=1 Tax=Hypsibius exemplaris TaxID=2072580 RepID=A0A1W0WYI5_HYPEX|nr:putative Transient receptor potential cation channel subfamily A member 1 [Hypsibius exemplaris]